MVVTIVVGVLGALIFDEKVMAAGTVTTKTTCQDIVDKKVTNDSLLRACNQWKSHNYTSEWGALWISNIGASNLSLAAKVVTDNLTISNDRLNVYMRGAVIGGTKDKYAECIKLPNYLSFMETNVILHGNCVLKKNGQTVRTVPNYRLLRPFNSNAFNKGITFAGTTLQLNLYSINGDPDGSDGYVGWGGTPTKTGGRIVYKNVGVDVYRCMEDTREDDDSCYSDKSEISIEGNVLKAKATVKSKSNGATSTTDYTTNTSKEAGMLMLSNCEKGCEVELSHEIKKGEYTFGHIAYYKITNSINRSIPEKWKNAIDVDASEGTVDISEGISWIGQKAVKLYPGEIYCSTMKFGVTLKKKSGTPADKELKYVKVCAAAMGTLKTDIGLDISKENKEIGMGYSNGVYYVQPGVFNFTAKLGTNVQKAYDIKLEKVSIDGVLFSQDSRSKTLNGIFKEGNLTWKNNLLLYVGNNRVKSWSYNSGTYCGKGKGTFFRDEVLSQDWNCDDPMVVKRTFGADSVGKQYTVEAVINKDDTYKTVPAQIKFDKYVDSESKKTYLRAVIGNTQKGYKLSVGVPYNFRNSTGLKEMNESESGKKYDVIYQVEVGDRFNETLGAVTYSTKVDNATSGVYWCKIKKGISVSSVIDPDAACEGAKETVTYDADRDREGIQSETLSPGLQERPVVIDLEEQKVEVGDTICVWSWVTPGRSGNDKLYDTRMDSNWSSNNIAYSWDGDGALESKRLCKSVGKKPTIQVWGGNVFSEGPLKVSGPFLREFDQGEGKEPEKRYYGSFGELGVFVSSTENAKNFASGAALGYSGFEEGSPWPRPSPIPNRDGVYVETVRNDGWFGGSTRQEDYGELRVYSYDDKNDKYIEYAKKLVNGLCNEKSDDVVGSKVECFYNTAKIYGGTITEGRVIYKLEGDVEIAGDLLYDKNETYGSLSEIPKFIIVTDGNININCDVTEVDALLVAGRTVNTCADGAKANNEPFRDAQEYSNQLTIYGAVIANKLVANRTFGAGPGVYSIVPAEIIKFDPSLYDLGIGSAGSEPRIVDVTELAPRY